MMKSRWCVLIFRCGIIIANVVSITFITYEYTDNKEIDFITIYFSIQILKYIKTHKSIWIYSQEVFSSYNFSLSQGIIIIIFSIETLK